MEGCKRLMTFTMAMASLWNLCQSEYLEGRIKTLEPWTFLARFCFLSGIGTLNYTLTFPAEYEPILLLMYYDEADQWPAVYKSSLSCMEKISPPYIIPERHQAISMDTAQYWSGCSKISDDRMIKCSAENQFDSARERWWYVAVSRCFNSTIQGIDMTYKILMTNGKKGDLWRYHFSVDEFNILEVDIAFLLGLLVLLVLASIAAHQLKKRLLFHTSYKLYMASLSFAVFHLFIMCIAYGKYANDGIRDEPLRTFGRVFEVVSVLIFVVMLLLMGKGFTITRGRISTSGSIKIAVFVTLYALTYAILFFYQAAFFDRGLVLYIYESPPGYGILVLRVVAWVYFSYACFFTVKHYPEKSKFYYPFYIFYTIWFLIGPVFVIVALNVWPKYMRAKIVNAVDISITFLAQAFLLFLTRPSNSNKNFPYHVRTSQIGILRDNDNQMQNFPAFAYSPSSEAYMYTSPNAGPDFSGLFSVARNVYERQENMTDSSSSSPAPQQNGTRNLPEANGRSSPVAAPSEDTRMPAEIIQSARERYRKRVPSVDIDRFPHEISSQHTDDPFVTTNRR